MAKCVDCRFHSNAKQREALGVASGDLEIVEFADFTTDILVCRHPSLEKEVVQGRADSDPPPGHNCEMFEKGTKKPLPPALEKLLAAALEEDET